MDLLRPASAPAALPVVGAMTAAAIPDPAKIARALAMLSTGSMDKMVGSNYLETLTTAGYCRNGKIDWKAAAAYLQRTEVAGILKVLAATCGNG